MRIDQGSSTVVLFLLTDKNDSDIGLAGYASTVTVRIGKNGGIFIAPTGSISEVGDGYYKFTLSATETNTEGMLILTAFVVGSPENISHTWREHHEVVNFAVSLQATDYDKIADHVLRRNFATATASGDGDTIQQSALINAARKLSNRTRNISGTLEIYLEDGTTIAYSQSVTTNLNAQPVTEVS